MVTETEREELFADFMRRMRTKGLGQIQCWIGEDSPVEVAFSTDDAEHHRLNRQLGELARQTKEVQRQMQQWMERPILLPDDELHWGKATAAWTTGNEVTLDPCDKDGTDNGKPNVTAYIISPTGGTLDDTISPEIAADDVVAYLPYGANLGLVVNVKWVLFGGQFAGDGVPGTVLFRAHYKGNNEVTQVLDSNDWRPYQIRWWGRACECDATEAVRIHDDAYAPTSGEGGYADAAHDDSDWDFISGMKGAAAGNEGPLTVKVRGSDGALVAVMGPGLSGNGVHFEILVDIRSKVSGTASDYTDYGNGH